MKLELPHIFSKYPPIYNFMEIHPVRAELFHEGRQTDGET
jgi:hypothetical protein